MAQVSQKNNPLQDGVNGQSKDKNSKYESNWEPVIGAKRFSNEVTFQIKASRAGKDGKWKNVREGEDDACIVFQNRLADFLHEKFPKLKEAESLHQKNLERNSYYHFSFDKLVDDIDLLTISFRSMTLPDDDNIRFTGNQLEMIHDHIILLGEEIFGKLDPNSSYDLVHSQSLTSGTFQMIEAYKPPFPIGDRFCFNSVNAHSFDLGPHIKKRVIDAGLVRRKVLVPHNTVVQYHSLDDMQGMSKIKLKNLPNEWQHTGVQIPMKDAYMYSSMDAKHGILRVPRSTAMTLISGEGELSTIGEEHGIPPGWVAEAINSMEIGERAIFRLSAGAANGSTGGAKDADSNGPAYAYVKYMGHSDFNGKFCCDRCVVQLGKRNMKVNGKEAVKTYESIRCCSNEVHCSGLRSICQVVVCALTALSLGSELT
eukprot:g4531.t1